MMKPLKISQKWFMSIFVTFVIMSVLGMNVTGYADITPVSDRTPQVRDAIVSAVPNVSDAANVTAAHLAAITSLNLRNAGITALKKGDFAGMTALTTLNLFNNQLSSLADGIFAGLTSLTTIRLGRNAVDPLPLTVSLEKIGTNQFRAVAPAGATYDIVLPVTVTRGSISGGATTLTIPHGGTESDVLTVVRTPGTTGHVTVNIGILPSLPNNHYGYALVKSDSLPLNIIRGANTVPVFTEGISTTRTIAENTTSGQNIGTAISATDVDNDTLTYTLSGTDATTFSIVSTSGQLQTKATLDYETKSTYTVTITVSDGYGGTDSITVTINITDVIEQQTSTTTYNVGDDITTLPSGFWVPDKTANGASYQFSNGQVTITFNNEGYIEKDGTTYTCTAAGGCQIVDGQVTQGTIQANGEPITPVTQPPPVTNTAPVFTDGTSTTRTIAENTASGIHIGTPVAATDADNDTLTYTLGGTDAAAFGIDATNGQLKTKAPLDYETKSTYTVTITVSDGSSTDTIAVTINITDVQDTQTESSYDHIEGPWLWMIAPGGNIDTDNLSEASDGVITETQIAQNGVNEGDHFNDLQWTSGRLLPTTVCGIFLCSSDNVINVVREIGLTKNRQLSWYSAYALINISSPRDQSNVLMGVGSDDSIKVWLNGSVVYINDTTRRTTGIQNRFHVNLNAGNNLLLIKVCNSGSWVGNDDWGMFFKLYLDTQDYTLSIPMRDTVEQQDTTNSAPVFSDGTSTTRTIAENTTSGIHIGTPVSATDADNDTLTYTLGGTDAAAFGIDATNGQLKTKAPLDYETKSTYTVTVTVSDGSLTDTITVTINVTDVNELPTVTSVCKVGDVLAPGESCTYPDTDAVFSVLANGKSQWNIPNLPSWLQWINQTSIGKSIRISTTINSVKYHFVAEEITGSSWEIKEIGNGGQQNPETPQPGNTEVTPTLNTSTASTLTEATLHEGVVSLNLSDGTFERSTFTIRNAITVSGISGLTFDRFGVDRVSDTKVTVELEFDGNMTTDDTFTISVGASAFKDYDGAALTSQLSVSAVTETITASTTASLTEATLDESVVTLTLSGRKFERWQSTIRPAVSVTGISGVTVRSFDIDRESDTEVSVELTYDGNMTSDGTLTFTVGAGAIAGYNGPSLTAQVSVSASTETPVVTEPETPQEPQQPQQPTQPGDIGGTPTLSLLTSSTLTEATLHGAVVSLNLSGGTYERAFWDLDDEISVSGITGVSYDDFFDVDRISDTQVNIELSFDGNMTSNGTLTFTVNSDAIVDYDDTDLTAQISVSAVTESITATTITALTEDNIDGSEVLITLSGRKFVRSVFDIQDAFSVSGITGVTIPWHDPNKDSDTELSLKLEFDGDMTQNGTLTFTVGADAIAGYSGPSLAAQLSVTATGANALLANFPNPFNPETWIPYQLSESSDVTITIYNMRGGLGAAVGFRTSGSQVSIGTVPVQPIGMAKTNSVNLSQAVSISIHSRQVIFLLRGRC